MHLCFNKHDSSYANLCSDCMYNTCHSHASRLSLAKVYPSLVLNIPLASSCLRRFQSLLHKLILNWINCLQDLHLHNHALHFQQPCSAPPTTLLCTPTAILCNSNNLPLQLQQPCLPAFLLCNMPMLARLCIPSMCTICCTSVAVVMVHSSLSPCSCLRLCLQCALMLPARC